MVPLAILDKTKKLLRFLNSPFLYSCFVIMYNQKRDLSKNVFHLTTIVLIEDLIFTPSDLLLETILPVHRSNTKV